MSRPSGPFPWPARAGPGHVAYRAGRRGAAPAEHHITPPAAQVPLSTRLPALSHQGRRFT